MKKCKDCIFFNKGLRVNMPYDELKKLIESTKAIGECDNIKVPSRICFSYGTICNEKYWVKIK